MLKRLCVTSGEKFIPLPGCMSKWRSRQFIWLDSHIYYAVSLYLRASIKYALVYGVQAVGEELGKELTAVNHELFELAKHVG